MPARKFGFEAEFGNNVEALAGELYSRGLTGSDYIHDYHCRCDDCSFSSSYPFRVQSDSSCGGEVISYPFCDRDQAKDMAAELESSTLQVDAEPDLRSGFHVHVHGIDVSPRQKGFLLLNFCLWEPTLEYIAAGRWPHRRAFNRSVREDVAPLVFHEAVNGTWEEWDEFVSTESDPHLTPFIRAYESDLESVLDPSHVFEHHFDSDRHNNLSVNSRHGTLEFRLWNATRSSWRMLLWVGLSRAFADEDLRPVLEGHMTGLEHFTPHALKRTKTRARELVALLGNNGYGNTAELLERQLTYLDVRAATAPGVLTAA